jgi:hypothetical protein
VKFKITKSQEFVIGGYTLPEGIDISESEAEALFKGRPSTGKPHDQDRQGRQRDDNNLQVKYAHSPLVRLYVVSTRF